jgi:hypothetical protein
MHDLNEKFIVFKNSLDNILEDDRWNNLNYHTLPNVETYLICSLCIYIEQSIQKRVLVVQNKQDGE